MAVGLNADGDYLQRLSIPSGGAGTLTGGSFANFFVGGWVYFPSSGNSYGATAGGAVFRGNSGARVVGIIKNSVGSAYNDPQMQALWDSGGGSGTETFVDQPPFDTWLYFYFTTDGSNMTAAWRELGNDTWHSETAANSNAGSQYLNQLYIGSSDTAEVLMGHYAYWRAVAAVKTAAEALAYSKSDVTAAGDWGFWPLANNTDTGDDSGNGYDLTFSGTLTSETSPTLGAPTKRFILVRP